jgi:hypothetical protein
MRHCRPALLAALLLLACNSNKVTSPSDGSVLPVEDGGGGGTVAGLGILTRLAGLWSGPATQTPVGDFPLMNVDYRPAGERVLFGRTDLSAGNALRFAFSIETFDGKSVLVYRNGGYFKGMLRDMRTKLVDFDEAAATYHFCHVDQGCDYIDARYTFDTPDHLIFDVQVKRGKHVLWQAQRKEARSLPSPFFVDQTSQGTGTAPFPPMPSLRATVSWQKPLVADADVWLLLSTTDCALGGGGCTISRSFMGTALAGATSTTLLLEQIHAGAYKANVVLDRNRNFATTLGPDTGDGVAIPNGTVTIAPLDETVTALSVVYDL